MADDPQIPPTRPLEVHIPVDIEEEMKRSYLDYAMSVIIGRALPDVRDGLKPVHRRVLYGMWEAGNRAGRPYKKTVDWVPNYDNSEHEPQVLPAAFPNLLVNGSSGIAVGMATNIPPHNFGEVVDALLLLIENPEVELRELIEKLPGPDFPTAGF